MHVDRQSGRAPGGTPLCSPISEVMREQSKQQNERDGYTNEIKQDRAHVVLLNRFNVIALPSTYGGRETRTKSSHQERQE